MSGYLERARAVLTRQERQDHPVDTVPSASDLRQCVIRARGWVDLDAACDEIRAAYEAGQIDAETAERLAGMAGDRSREIPEDGHNAALLEMSLSTFARSGVCCEVESGVLGGKILLAADNALAPADTRLVVSGPGTAGAPRGLS